MERVLFGKEGIKVDNNCHEIVFLPVRHHSPACAWHLKNIIQSIQPKMVLIEGPSNANDLIDQLSHEDTKPPFAIYYSYHDKTARVNEEKGHYKCYYPFIDYSPELVGIKQAVDNNAKAMFIDMPYGDILVASKEGKGLLQKAEKNTYNDDYLVSRSSYSKRLCEKEGLRSFDEFWEKYFEVNGLSMDSEKWFDSLLFYCNATREESDINDLYEEGCIQREQFMSENIAKLVKQMDDNEGGNIVVITGGFHTSAIKERVEKILSNEETESIKLVAVPQKDQAVYLMPYSMNALASLNGYTSGMPYPEFYERVYEEILNNEDENISSAYDKACLGFLVSTGKNIRKRDGGISTYDEIIAYQMLGNLCALRGKLNPGAYELLDAVLSTYVKGEYNIATDEPLRELNKQLIGNRLGKLCASAAVPAIICDFQNRCAAFGLNNTSVVENEVTLSIFSSKKHRQMSMFFAQLNFLNTGYAKKVKGPNLQKRTDRNLIREIWKYRWSPQVQSTLIDVSVYGSTIEEATISIIREKMTKGMAAGEAAMILTQIFEMGLDQKIENLSEILFEFIQADSNFYSLADALKYLKMMQEMKTLYDSDIDVTDVMGSVTRKLISLLPGMTGIKDDNLKECMEVVKLLYQITQADEEFVNILAIMKQDYNINAGLNGCVNGLLYGCGYQDATSVMYACNGYLMGTDDKQALAAQFLHGLFFAAKDIIFIDDTLIVKMNEFLQDIDADEFMELLPEFRMSFAYFTPREIDRIARRVSSINDINVENILFNKAVSPKLMEYAKQLDRFVVNQMVKNDGR